MIKKTIIALGLSASALFATNNIQLNINSNTLELYGEYSLNKTYNLSSDAGYSFSLSYLGSEKTALNSQSTDRQINLGLKIMNPYINDYGFSFGLGVNFVWVNNSSDSFIAIPLGVYGQYELNDNISFNSSLSYAPKVLAFSDAKTYTSFDFKANYRIIDNGHVYIGIRDIKTKYSNNEKLEFDDSIFFGYKVKF